MCWRTQAKVCSSPNGGPVMIAGVGALNVRLSEGAYYLACGQQESGQEKSEWQKKPPMGCGEPAQALSIQTALELVQRTLLFWLFSIGGLVFVL